MRGLSIHTCESIAKQSNHPRNGNNQSCKHEFDSVHWNDWKRKKKPTKKGHNRDMHTNKYKYRRANQQINKARHRRSIIKHQNMFEIRHESFISIPKSEIKMFNVKNQNINNYRFEHKRNRRKIIPVGLLISFCVVFYHNRSIHFSSLHEFRLYNCRCFSHITKTSESYSNQNRLFSKTYISSS